MKGMNQPIQNSILLKSIKYLNKLLNKETIEDFQDINIIPFILDNNYNP